MEMRWRHATGRTWLAVGAAVAVALTLSASAAASSSPQAIARAASRCNIVSEYYSLGPTYVESLKVSNTNCTTGVNVIKAFNQCRIKAGGVKGHCYSKVLGFTCSEKRYPGPIQFIGKARCTSGRKSVTFSYSENNN